jgi:hypothetical protein
MTTVAPFHVLRQILEPNSHVRSTLLTLLQICLLPTQLASHLVEDKEKLTAALWENAAAARYKNSQINVLKEAGKLFGINLGYIIRDVYPGFRILILSIPDPGVKKSLFSRFVFCLHNWLVI